MDHRSEQAPAEVSQVERRDFVDLVPEDAARRQPLAGFEPIYADIVDYIVRCTHRIWDERNPGLIYDHYAHNAVTYGPLGTTHSREEVVRETIQRMAEFPERRGMAIQVIWRGDERDGFYTSHLVTGVGRNTQPSAYGPGNNRRFATRTIADCMVFENRIYREWLVRDTMAMATQCGADIDALATRMAAEHVASGAVGLRGGDGGRLLGQYPPEAAPDLSIAHDDDEARVLGWLHDIYNRRLFGATVRAAYAPAVQWHGPAARERWSAAAVIAEIVAFMAMVPDAGFAAHHVCSIASQEGGRKVAVRWTIEGHHLGRGVLGAPTGKPLFVMGISHFHMRDGRIVEEWTLYDELALLVQTRLPD